MQRHALTMRLRGSCAVFATALAAMAGMTVAASLIAGGCASNSRAPAPTPSQQVASLLRGTFSSAAQANADGRFQSVVLRGTPVWTDRTDAQWIYMEQALTADPERPIRQRVFRISESSGAVECLVLSLPGDPWRHAGAWRNAHPLNELTPELLEVDSGCVITLRPAGPSTFRGATDGPGCPTTRDGAAFIRTELALRPGAIDAWDRGFDANGKQVWGATAGPYRFDRISSSSAASLGPPRDDGSASPLDTEGRS